MGGIMSFIFGVAFVIYRAFVASLMWGWFVMPTFGIATPSIPMMIGLLFMVSVVFPSDLTKDGVKASEKLIYHYSIVTSGLIFGYLISLGVA